jgi:hypothetical protein
METDEVTKRRAVKSFLVGSMLSLGCLAFFLWKEQAGFIILWSVIGFMMGHFMGYCFARARWDRE